MEEVFIIWAEKQTIMCLCGVTERSGHVDRTRRSVHLKLQCLQCDRTLAQSPVSSFDQGDFVWCDQTLRNEVTGH